MMVTGKANVDVHSSDHTNNDSGSFPTQSFPPDGLVAMSRIAYQNTPLSTEKIGQGVFVFRGAGGTRILSLINTRLTVSEIMDASPTAEFDATWGKGYVTGVHFTRIVLAGT